VTADETYTLMIDIGRGLTPETSRLAPLTPALREKWDRLASQIAEIRDDGGMESIPFDS
jgi:hypothetical protein